MKTPLVIGALIFLSWISVANYFAAASAEQDEAALHNALDRCPQAVWTHAATPEDAAGLLQQGSYGCVFLADGRYGYLIWRVVQDERGAPFVAHMEHFWKEQGRWKPQGE